jgi:endonuclease/exonuclease/phosphatase family metal-dependent hydrolase
LAAVLAFAVAVLAAVVLVPSSSFSLALRQNRSSYGILQMNLCLSGMAGCFGRTAYPAVVNEAVDEVRNRGPQVVTLNEVCSRDARELARKTRYRIRFAAVRVRGATLPCIDPGRRGVFGIAVLTRDAIRTSHDQAFAIHTGREERRWMCATTVHQFTVCTAHLSTRGSTAARRANDAECTELQGVLARYDEAGMTAFGGDVNRHGACAPRTMWVDKDTDASQIPGIQQIYGSMSVRQRFARVSPATYTDHDFLMTTGPFSGGGRDPAFDAPR